MRFTPAFFLFLALFLSLGMGMLDHVVEPPRLHDAIALQYSANQQSSADQVQQIEASATGQDDRAHGCDDPATPHPHYHCDEHHHHVITTNMPEHKIIRLSSPAEPHPLVRLDTMATPPAFRPPITA